MILVGHSIGGFSVTHAIHKFGEKTELAVYLAAAMNKNNIGVCFWATSTSPTNKQENKNTNNSLSVLIRNRRIFQRKT